MLNSGLANGQSPQSAAHWRAVLRIALNIAMRHGLVGRNVASLAEPPHIPEREVHALTPTNARALLDAVEGDRLEALGLQWQDIDLDGGTLTVQRTLQRIDRNYRFLEPKTRGSRRTMALPKPVAKSLGQHHAHQLVERLLVGPDWQGEKWGELVFADEAGGPLAGFHVSRRF